MSSVSESRPPLSIPRLAHAPRSLTTAELETIELIADTLVPAVDPMTPAASAESGFRDQLNLTLDARSDAFDDIVAVLASLADVDALDMFSRLRSLGEEQPASFQALSTVVAGAWLLTAGVRDRIGYHGPRADRAGLEDAADELSTGVLDPVLDRYPPDSPRWIR